jgi:hypothetical protein
MKLALRERFDVAETWRFVAMVLYPESVSFILHHDSQPDLPFNQEFPLGVTFLYFLWPDGHNVKSYLFLSRSNIWILALLFFYSQYYQHGGRKNNMVGAVVHYVM